MIPKKIHYCWFGGAKKTPLIEKCIDSWRRIMPEYEIKEWNESNFDLQSAPEFVKEALAARKWAFIADYVRLHAMYTEGGVYMDTDVKVLRPFDEFLDHAFFTCQEPHLDIFNPESIDSEGRRNPKFPQVLGIGLCSAVMGAEKGCAFLKDCLDYYNTLHFSTETMNDVVIVNTLAVVLEKYGYRYILDREQVLPIEHIEHKGTLKPETMKSGTHSILIMQPWVFGGVTTQTKDTYALHLYNGSWVEGNDTLKHRIRNHFPTLYTAIQNLVRKLKASITHV